MPNISDQEYIALLKSKHELEMNKKEQSRSDLYKKLNEAERTIEKYYDYLPPCDCGGNHIYFDAKSDTTGTSCLIVDITSS